MKKTIMRIASILLTLVLTAGILPVSAWAREGLTWTVQEQTRALPEIVTGGAAISPHSANPLPLAEGNHERWIDRLADIPAYAMALYQWMEENSDGDGSEDALIQVESARYLSGNYVYLVTTCAESVPFTVAADADDETIMAVGARAANAVIDENLARVGDWVSAVVQAFDRDHGQVFWLSGSNRIFMPSSQIRFEFNGTDWKAVFEQRICMILKSRSFDIREEEYREEAFLRETIRKRDQAVSRILPTVTGTTRQEQIRQINAWLTKHNCYNSGTDLTVLGADARNCIGALEGRVGEQGPVCEGYARAFQVLCKALGTPCVLVDGQASNGSRTQGHMWNYVQMENGKWYAVDVTWNDPGIPGITAAESGYEWENFLLCGSDTVVGGMPFLQSHPVSNTVTDGGPAFVNGPVLEREAYVVATGHDFGSWERLDDLVHQRSCMACGHKETELHAWGEETVSENGITRTQSCSICQYAKQKKSPMVGVWETDMVFPAADMGVQAPDIVFRCKLTFEENGTVRADWEPVELTAIRMYFHTLFVSAYYACAYGAGITSFEEAERFCVESTGMGVSAYMDAFLNGFDMYALFKPESTEGSYRINSDGNAMYTDLRIMAIESNPEAANPFTVSEDTLEWAANSYEKPEYTFYCTRITE